MVYEIFCLPNTKNILLLAMVYMLKGFYDMTFKSYCIHYINRQKCTCQKIKIKLCIYTYFISAVRFLKKKSITLNNNNKKTSQILIRQSISVYIIIFL